MAKEHNLATLKKIAEDRLYATSTDDEQWGFIFSTEESFDLDYIPHNSVESLDFDLHPEQNEQLLWEPKRFQDLLNDESNPTEIELSQWQALSAKETIQQCNWEYVYKVWIVPIWIEQKIEAYALFDCGCVTSVSDPFLLSMHLNIKDAKAAVEKLGILNKSD